MVEGKCNPRSQLDFNRITGVTADTDCHHIFVFIVFLLHIEFDKK
jgi:hypothetical protein